MSTEQVDQHPDLLVSPGWVIDGLSIGLMHRRLASLPPDVAAVAASTGPLPPGSSYRVVAERLALRDDGFTEAPPGGVAGASLVRPGVDAHVDDSGLIQVAGATVVDSTTFAHDPWATVLSIGSAVAAGRSPFPRRPIVLFLSLDASDDLEGADWCRRMTNELVRLDVEGRLAQAGAAPGLHLTRPCLPDEAAFEALRPEIVVCLGEEAHELASDLSRSDRRTVLIEYSLDPTVGIDLVPWHLSRGPGRARARVGQAVGAKDLAGLVNRLCSGPQPLPPPVDALDVNTTPVPLPKRPAGTVTRRALSIFSATDVPSAHLQQLRRYAALSGYSVTVAATRSATPDVPVALIDSSISLADATRIIEDRIAIGRRTIVDVGRSEDQQRRLELAAMTGYGVATDPEHLHRLERAGVSFRALPRTYDPEVLASVRAARTAGEKDLASMGIVLTNGSHEPLEAASNVRDRAPDLVVHAWCVERDIPGPELPDWLHRHDSPPSLPQLAAMAVVLDPRPAAPKDHPDHVLLASMLGVHTVFLRAVDRPYDRVLGRFGLEQGATTEEWTAAACEALEFATPGSAVRLAARADALAGQRTSTSRVRRFLGWAVHGAPTP